MLLSKNFKYNIFFESLNSYLTFIMNSHAMYAVQVVDKRTHIRTFLTDNQTIESLKDSENCTEDILIQIVELEELENKMNEYFLKTIQLHEFSNSFPEDIYIIKGLEFLNQVMAFFVEREEYEQCITIKEVIDILSE